MPLPHEAGRYIAKPQGWGVDQSTHGAVEFACDFALLHFFNPATSEWEDVAHQGMRITGYFYPIDKEGNAVTKTIARLKESLGWSGSSFAELNEGDWSNTEVQVTVEQDSYQGKTQMKVKWLNPRDYAGGGVGKGDPEKVKSFDQRFGSKLRALGGTAPTNGAAKPAATQRPTPTAADAAKGKAWSAYQAKYAGSPADEVKEGFRQAFKAYFPAKKPELVLAGDWEKFIANGFEKPVPVAPFGGEEEFKDDDIPF